MDIFIATASLNDADCPKYVLDLRKGDLVEVLNDLKFRKEKLWWGVRRLKDYAVGIVPSRFLQFDETIPAAMLPKDYFDQKEKNIESLERLQDIKVTKEKDSESDKIVPEPDYPKESANVRDPDEQISPGSPSVSPKPKSPSFEPKIILPHPDKQFLSADVDLQIRGQKPENPNLTSKEKMALHSELKHNIKGGIDVLNRKSEFKKGFDKMQEKKRNADKVKESTEKTPFEKILEERKKKTNKADEEESSKKNTDGSVPEFLRVQQKITKSLSNTS